MQESDTVHTELPVPDVTMSESNEPVTGKSRLDLLVQHVLMLHGGEAQDGEVNETVKLQG